MFPSEAHVFLLPDLIRSIQNIKETTENKCYWAGPGQIHRTFAFLVATISDVMAGRRILTVCILQYTFICGHRSPSETLQEPSEVIKYKYHSEKTDSFLS